MSELKSIIGIKSLSDKRLSGKIFRERNVFKLLFKFGYFSGEKLNLLLFETHLALNNYL